MPYSPAEIRHVRLGRALLGYKRADVNRLLEEVTLSFEDVWRERADLADKVEQLEEDLVRYHELEALLRKTLVSAERAAQEVKEQAKRQADLILSEAHAEARGLHREAIAERDRLEAESARVRSTLRAALDVTEQRKPRDARDAKAEALVGGASARA
jgi:cell division initiation protein